MVGRVAEIGRFAVKSMQGEAPTRVAVGASGVSGDRVHAVVDVETGKIASAKDPRAWAGLFQLRAAYVDEPASGAPLEITLAGGRTFRSDAGDADDLLSAAVGRRVRIESSTDTPPMYDLVWENTDVAPEATIAAATMSRSDEGHPISTVPAGMQAPGTFQDVAPITVLTTGALAAMRALHPAGDWSVARFRPNFLIELDDATAAGVVENEWAGRRLAIGEVVIEISTPSPRCVMTTLAQPGLARDRDILKTIAAHNRIEVEGWGGRWACLGAYATVVEPGSVSVGDPVRLI